MEPLKPAGEARTEVANIGKSVVIKGELSGSEDLFVDGEVEGSIELREHHLTVGPNGRIRASVQAHEVVVYGKLDGNVRGAERVQLKRTAILTGDIVSKRIVIEDGAVLKGSVEVQPEAVKPAVRREAAAVAAATTSHASPPASGATAAPAPTFTPASLMDQKK
jgi:cytoskeletal protein CcmA (bactofilin family)